MRLWRLAAASHAALDGEGTRRYGSRWTPHGYAVVYASATLSLAALECLVHADPDLQPPSLVAISIDVPSGVVIKAIDRADLPPDWRDYPAPASLAALGARWLESSASAVLSVPSVLIPTERNYLLDPSHAQFRRCSAGSPEPFLFDRRLPY
ncbi:MAG TPA: RES domain-containing protein [Gemmatimonadaceae bacterium]|nr:RES domain-containing protein [Gemmatimonadaceae bacterium]